MEKHGGINVKESLQQYRWAREYTYTYFKTPEEAQAAKEWLDGMIMNLTLVGRDELYRQKEAKSAENHEKKVSKIFAKLTPFKGYEVYVSVHTYVGGNMLEFEATIDDITRDRDDITIKMGRSQIKGTYSNFEVIDGNMITQTNNGMNSSVKILKKF